MKKVVILLLAVLFVFAGCDGSIGGGVLDPDEPMDPDDIVIETIPTGPKFRGDLSSIGVDENGLITFADYNDSYDFREKYLINGDGEKLLLSWLIPYQDMKPEYQAEYDNVFMALSEEYSTAQRNLEDDLQAGLISVSDYYTQLEILEDEYSAKRDVLDVEWENRSGVWGDVRVRVSGKNLTETPVDLYLVDTDYETGGYQLIGPIEFKAIDGWQSFIYRFDNGGKRYDHVNSGYSYHMEI